MRDISGTGVVNGRTTAGKTSGWVKVAKDRDKWREVINAGLRHDDKKP